MDILQLIARVLHVGIGVFWAGTIFFMVYLLEPSVRSIGPDGGKVMQALVKKNLLNIIPAAATITVLSGVYLMWWSSGGFASNWFSTSFGMTLSIGTTAAVIAYVLGIFLMRPATMKIGALAASLASMDDASEHEATMKQMDALKLKTRTYSQWIAIFLAAAVVTMAVARYV